MEQFAYVALPFCIALGLTPIVRWLAIKMEVYAQVNERTVHHGKIARIGGVAIYIAFMCSVVYFYDSIDSTILALLIGGAIVFLGGLIDDMVNLKPMLKLAFQVVAAIVFIGIGGAELGTIHLPFGISIDMGWFSYLITFLWIIGITNAINLIDGLDGLAGGVCTIVLLTISSISFFDGRFLDIGVLSLILSGSILGFLPYNIHPAKLFMGDCGALFLGYVIAAISLVGFKSSTFITLGFPILLLAVPIVDTLSAMLRRFLHGKKFTEADKHHLHHVLMQRYGHRNTVFIIYLITLGFGISAYVYIFDRAIGLILIGCIFLALEIFIEQTAMISENYHPLTGLWKRLLNQYHKLAKTMGPKESENSDEKKQETE